MGGVIVTVPAAYIQGYLQVADNGGGAAGPGTSEAK